MSWLYLPGGAEVSLQQSGSSAGGTSATSKKTRTAKKSSKRVSKTAGSTTRRSGMTPELSMVCPGVESWIASLRASHASPSVEQENSQEKTTPEIFGRTPFALLEKSSPNGVYWKMSQGSLPFLISDEYSATWPRAALMLRGIAFQLLPLVRLTRGTDYGLLPTPVAGPFGSNTYMRARGQTAKSRILTWPTLRAKESGAWQWNGSRTKKTLALAGVVKMWPTPTSSDHKGANKNPSAGRKASDHNLPTMVAKYPTPTTKDNRNTSQASKEKYRAGPTLGEFVGGTLNPAWNEWLMGWPVGWSALEPLEMDKFQKWLRLHGVYLARD